MRKSIVIIITTLLISGCAGIWDATFKVLDATTAVVDCADGEEYKQEVPQD